MSFELSVPKTRKEYFMAIACGGVVGEDFPARYEDSSKNTPLQPKTVEEAYFANLAEFDVSTALSKMQIKSRKDQYLNAIINAADDGDGTSGK